MIIMVYLREKESVGREFIIPEKIYDLILSNQLVLITTLNKIKNISFLMRSLVEWKQLRRESKKFITHNEAFSSIAFSKEKASPFGS